MKLHQAFGIVLNRFGNLIFRILGRDRLTYERIVARKDLQQIGTEYGGWVIPISLFESDSVCYCAGCGEDISFDLGLIEKFDCTVFAFDPTPRAIEYVVKHSANNDKYHFFDFGLWNKEDILKFYAPKNPEHVSHSILNLQKTEDYFEAQVKRLSSIMQDNGHTTLDLLKLDIEGAEYRVVDTIVEDKLDIRIVCVEYDEYFNPLDQNYQQRIKESVRSIINLGYSVVCAKGGHYTFVKNT